MYAITIKKAIYVSKLKVIVVFSFSLNRLDPFVKGLV
jgi:hypothetical protein